MKRVVRYIAVDPYYTDFEEVYIGASAYEIDEIQYETEEHISQFHYSLSSIYKKEIIFEDVSY